MLKRWVIVLSLGGFLLKNSFFVYVKEVYMHWKKAVYFLFYILLIKCCTRVFLLEKRSQLCIRLKLFGCDASDLV